MKTYATISATPASWTSPRFLGDAMPRGVEDPCANGSRAVRIR